MKPAGRKIDTRALGLDLGTDLVRFLTGRENLHYGIWEEGLDVCASNLLAAQKAYSDRLLSMLPPGRLRILDIGGGAGETAGELQGLGHDVEIVVPSPVLAERCRVNAGDGAKIHVVPFEEFAGDRIFDVCLFSESFQYIGIEAALTNAAANLADDGVILISDCFRTPAFGEEFSALGMVGGGHGLERFRKALADMSMDVIIEDDITALVAPSVELEQQFFNMIGRGARRIDRDFSIAYPRLRWIVLKLFRRMLGERRRTRLERRLFDKTRTPEAFCRFNCYLMLKIRPSRVDAGENRGRSTQQRRAE